MGSDDASAIIRGLKSHFGVRSDDALSEKIGVAKSTIATWRRRRSIPGKTMDQLAIEHGLTVSSIMEARQGDLLDYMIRQCRYHMLLKMSDALFQEDGLDASLEALADDLAVIEPYLDRVLVKASTKEATRGISGAVTLLMGLRSGDVDVAALMEEAKADRLRDLEG